MKTKRQLNSLGQNRWLDNITGDLREIKAPRRIRLDAGIVFPVMAIDRKTGTTAAIYEFGGV